MNNRSRGVSPALDVMLYAILVVAFLLCSAAPGAAQEKNDGEPPPLDWSQDTVALLPDGTPATHGRQYAVQVAKVHDLGSAREMAADLATRGHHPYILTMADESGALWHAVRLDIHDSIVAALQAARKFYEAEGVPPSIVQTGSLSGLPVEDARFFVQVAAFESQDNALHHAADLASQGLDAGVVRRQDAKDGAVWNVVHIGVFDTFEKAASRANGYGQENDCGCYVVVIDRELLEKNTLPLPEQGGLESAASNSTAPAISQPPAQSVPQSPTRQDNASPTAAPNTTVSPANATRR